MKMTMSVIPAAPGERRAGKRARGFLRHVLCLSVSATDGVPTTCWRSHYVILILTGAPGERQRDARFTDAEVERQRVEVPLPKGPATEEPELCLWSSPP